MKPSGVVWPICEIKAVLCCAASHAVPAAPSVFPERPVVLSRGIHFTASETAGILLTLALTFAVSSATQHPKEKGRCAPGGVNNV